MLTVIFVQQDALEGIFGRFEFLFQPFVNSGELKFCAWNPAGKTDAEAIPDIYNVVGNAERWRAVVLTDLSGRGERDIVENPFDTNTREQEAVVRLAKILGGVTDEVETETKRADVKGGKPTIETHIKRVSKEEEEHARFHTVRPEIAIFISPRIVKENPAEEFARLKTKICNEIESSRFYDRNDYPGICRFVVYDIPEYTYSKVSQDACNTAIKQFFGFFLTALLLSLNRMSPSAFQSYRLYSADVGIEKEPLGKALNFLHRKNRQAVKELENIKYQLYKKVTDGYEFDNKRELAKVISMSSFDNQDRKCLDTAQYGLCKDTPQTDTTVYFRELEEVDEALEKMLKRFRRSLANAGVEARLQSELSKETKALPVGKLQLEDIDEYILKKEKEMAMLAVGNAYIDQDALVEKERTDRLLRKNFFRRMTKKRAFFATFAGFACVVAGFLPFAYNIAIKQELHWSYPALFVGVIFGVLFAVSAVLIMVYDWFQLRKLLARFNKAMHTIYDRLQEVSHQLSEYLTGCVCYMRGKALYEYKTRDISKDKERYSIFRHGNALDSAHRLCETLADCYGVSINQGDMSLRGIEAIDINKEPVEDVNYHLPVIGREVPLNEDWATGTYVRSPYDFISNFSLKRVEVFDEKETEDSSEKSARNEKEDKKEIKVDGADNSGV